MEQNIIETYIYTYMHTSYALELIAFEHIYTHASACICNYIYIYIYIYTYIHVHIHTYAGIYMCTYAYVLLPRMGTKYSPTRD